MSEKAKQSEEIENALNDFKKPIIKIKKNYASGGRSTFMRWGAKMACRTESFEDFKKSKSDKKKIKRLLELPIGDFKK